MVNPALTDIALAERRVILAYAPTRAREGLAALLALDDTLGAILRSTREPMVGQMRLTWWHDALASLDERAPPAEPVLQRLSAHVLPHVPGGRLAEMIDGWDALLDDTADLDAYAEGRGARLFAAAATVLGAASSDPIAAAGRGWALADLAANSSDPGLADRAGEKAAVALASATGTRWSRDGRALGAMAHLARRAGASPRRRVARIVWHRLTGR